jgi:hypothetical protein
MKNKHQHFEFFLRQLTSGIGQQQLGSTSTTAEEENKRVASIINTFKRGRIKTFS